MELFGEHRWSRSKYPLQPATRDAAPCFPVTLSLHQADKPSLDQLMNNTDSAMVHSSISRLRNNSNHSAHPPVNDVQAFDESSTIAASSHRSVSPPPVRHDGQSPPSDAEGATLSVQSQVDEQNPASCASSPRTGNACSLQNETGVLPGHSSEQDPGRIATRVSQRTLRRTPRSRRIPPSGVEELPLPAQTTKAQSNPASESNSETQQAPYYMQSTTDGSMVPTSLPLPAASKPAKTAEAHSDEPSEVSEAPPGNSSWQQRRYPLQPSTSGSTTLPVSPLPSGSELEDENRTATNHPSESNEAVKAKKKTSQRQKYPLQSPASHADLQHPPSPPTPPEPKRECVADPFADHQPMAKPKPLRRRVYPLQSPASVQDLRHSLTPPPSPPARDAENSTQQAPDHIQDSSRAAPLTQRFRRQGYPLQTSASIPALRHSPTPPPSPPESDAEANEEYARQSQADETVVRDGRTFSRHTYPLQVPMGSLAPQPLEGKTLAKGSSSANVGIPILQLPDGNAVSEDNAPAKQARANELAAKVIEHWRRQVYPLQSPKGMLPFVRPSTPQPPEETEKQRKPETIHLPKSIRAVKDAENQSSRGRTIVVCLDGTGDKFDNDNSNIVHLISALKKDDKHQVSYYQAGLGTYSAGGLSSGMSAALDMAVGSGLGLHVRDAYDFLMHSYKEGDKICIFGFSRGAYTARCLAGMVHKVGLLPPRNVQQIPFAYEFYANDTPEGWKQSEDFKKTFSIDVCVHFLGCFDSVNSVGFIPRQLPLSSTPTSKPRYFRHAMALDERRAKFKVCRHQKKDWNQIRKSSASTGAIVGAAESNPPGPKKHHGAHSKYSSHKKYGKDNHPNITDEEYNRLIGDEDAFETDVLEVWFAGAHADVGGGAVANDERHKLAQIPLRWMIRQAFECDTGVIFKTKVLAEYGLDVHTLWPKYERLKVPSHGPSPSYLEKFEKDLPPRWIRREKLVPCHEDEKGKKMYHLKSHTDEDWTPEQVEDFYDAMSPLNDQLVEAPSWWILEAWPVEYKVPIAPGKVITRVGMNMGQYRGVDDFEPNLHWTVRHREEHTDYKIRARTAPHTKWRIVV